MIVKFRDSDQRQRFVNLVERERPDIRPLLREQYSMPTLTVKRASDEQEGWIVKHLEPYGQAYEDVQFEAM